MRRQVMRLVAYGLIGLALGACSVSTLRCGTDGESSFVDLVNVPQDISSQVRYFTELCAFGFEGEQP